MLISPKPMPPCPFLYSADDFARLQTNHVKAVEAWERESNCTMLLNAVPIICACIGVSFAALLGPSVVLDAIAVLVK